MSNGVDEILDNLFGPKNHMDYNLEKLREIKIKLREALVNYRKSEGYTQARVANILGWKLDMLEKFENGELDSKTIDSHLEDYALSIGAVINYTIEKFTRE